MSKQFCYDHCVKYLLCPNALKVTKMSEVDRKMMNIQDVFYYISCTKNCMFFLIKDLLRFSFFLLYVYSKPIFKNHFYYLKECSPPTTCDMSNVTYMIRRPGRSQGLLYKHIRHSLINSLTHPLVPTALRRHHGQTAGHSSSSYEIDYIIVIKNFLNL